MSDCSKPPRPASVDIKPKGWTALHRAAAKNYYPRVNKLCLTTPEDIEAVTNEGLTPIQIAAQYGSVESFLALTHAGANTSVVTEEGGTLIQLAAGTGRLYFLMALINHPPNTRMSILTEICTYLYEMTPNHAAFTQAMLILESLLVAFVTKSYESKTQVTKLLQDLRIVTVFENILKRCTQERLVTVAISASKSLLVITPLLAEYITSSKIPKLLLDMTYVIVDYKTAHVALSVLAEIIRCVSNCLTLCSAIGGPIAMFKVLQMHRNVELHIVAMSCIIEGGKNPQVAELFASKEILQELLKVFNMKEQNIEMIRTTIKALQSLMQSSSEVKRKCIELGLVEKLLQLFKPFDSLTEPCVTLLYTLCDSKETTVVELLKEHPSAISDLLLVTKHDVNIHIKQISFEILWCTAGNDTVEQRALGRTIKPNSLISLTKRAKRCQALVALELISPVVYDMQADIINECGIPQLVAILQSTSESQEMILALKTLENLSYEMCLQPNREAQKKLQEINGLQLILKLFENHPNERVKHQAFCTLAGYSNKSPSIKQLLFDTMSLSEIIQPLQDKHRNMSNEYVRGVCYLAFNSLVTQSKMTSHGGISTDSFLHNISTGTPLQVVEAAFQLIILARVFVDCKPSVTVAFGLRQLMKSLTQGIQECDIELQVTAGLYISALIRMRAGLANGLYGLGLLSLLLAMLFGDDQSEISRVASVCLIQLTYHPAPLRQILRYLRQNSRLYTSMVKHSCNFVPSWEFLESWKQICQSRSYQPIRQHRTRSPPKSGHNERLVTIDKSTKEKKLNQEEGRATSRGPLRVRIHGIKLPPIIEKEQK